MKGINYYVADFENNTPKPDIYDENGQLSEIDYGFLCEEQYEEKTEFEEIEQTFETRVWAAALGLVMENPTEDDVQIATSLDGFVRRLQDLPNKSVVYFHNLSYDGPLLLTYLLSKGYTESKNGTPYTEEEIKALSSIYDREYIEEQSEKRKWNRWPDAKEFTSTITADGIWYCFRVRFSHSRKCIEFRDSLKILPFSVDKIAHDLKTKAQKLKGTIDYNIFRDRHYVMDETEEKYIKNDVLVLMEALYKVQEYNLLDSLTIASACMKDFKTDGGRTTLKEANKHFRDKFPVLDHEIDMELRKAYRGGWCYVHRPNEIFNNVKGEVYDVNSLYPSCMYHHQFPIGEPHYFEGKDFLKHKFKPYYVKIMCTFKVKDGHLPFIQIKNNRWADNEYIRNSGNDPVELVLARPDFELFLEQYDTEYDIICGWWFYGDNTIFDEYVMRWYELKKKAAAEKNLVLKMIAKLFLNSLYGKFAMSQVQSCGHPYLDENNVLKIKGTQVSSDGVYIPIGAYITSYAKNVTIRAAQKNYDIFCYADTDSIHCLNTANDIDTGKELGQWDHETSFDRARFVRQKTYIEHTTAEDEKPINPYWNIKACGATDEVKTRLLYKVTDYYYDEKGRKQAHFKRLERDEDEKILNEKRSDDEIIERFTHGMIEAGKLTKRKVSGGSIIIETTFAIR